MNTNQLHGTVTDIVGRVQEAAGRLLGNKRQQIKGLQKQVLGRAEKQLGDNQETGKHVVGPAASAQKTRLVA